MSRDLATARTRPDLARVTLRHLHDLFGGTVRLLLPDEGGRLDVVAETAGGRGSTKDLGVAQWVFEHGEAAGLGTADAARRRGPLSPPGDARSGASAWWASVPSRSTASPTRPSGSSLEALLGQAAVALERTQLAEEKRLVHLEFEAEQLRTSLLSSLSHDLRTPLAGIEGAASSLARGQRAARRRKPGANWRRPSSRRPAG